MSQASHLIQKAARPLAEAKSDRQKMSLEVEMILGRKVKKSVGVQSKEERQQKKFDQRKAGGSSPS